MRAASYLGSTTSTGDSSQNFTIRALTDWGLKGTAGSIGIGVIDSGIAPGPEFENRISAFYDFTNGDIRATNPTDEYGHGSHVAGLIAGRNVGIAPGARLVGLKVLDNNGRGSASDVLRAIEFAIANKVALNLHILNLSLGHPIYESAATDPLVQAVERAVREGLVVVVSAGNFGINTEDRAARLCGYRVARQCAICFDSRCDPDLRHGDATRRPGCGVQLARAVVVRRIRQAGRRRSGR